MKAYIYDKAAKNGMAFIDNLVSVADEAPQDHVVVQVKSVSLNPIDYKKPGIPVLGWGINKKPVGQDFAGIVLASKSKQFDVGDSVFGFSSHCFTEKIVVPAKALANKPSSISFHEAASLPTVAITTLQALRKADTKAGSNVAVIGASGGCGIMGVMIAHHLVGAEGKVVGICSPSNAEFVKSLGANETVDYNDLSQFKVGPESTLSKYGPFGVVYDTVTSPDAADSVGGTSYDVIMAPFLGPKAMTVALNGGAMRWVRLLLGMQGAGYSLITCNANPTDLNQVADWAAAGVISPKIDSVFEFTEAGCTAAYERVKSRRSRGKVVINVSGGDAK